MENRRVEELAGHFPTPQIFNFAGCILRSGTMPVGTDTHETGSVSWWAADVAADDSGETTLLGGDIRLTDAGDFPIKQHVCGY